MDPAIIQEPNLPNHSSNEAIMDKSIKYDESEKIRMDSLLNSYQEVLDKISHQENCLKQAKDKITLLQLDISKSTKREEETQIQFLQTEQEFTDYRTMIRENFQKVLKSINLEDIKEDQVKTNSETEIGADQVPISPLVNEVTPADTKENKEEIPKLQLYLNNSQDDNKLTNDVSGFDGSLHEETTYENMNPGRKRKLGVDKTTQQKRCRIAKKLQQTCHDIILHSNDP